MSVLPTRRLRKAWTNTRQTVGLRYRAIFVTAIVYAIALLLYTKTDFAWKPAVPALYDEITFIALPVMGFVCLSIVVYAFHFLASAPRQLRLEDIATEESGMLGQDQKTQIKNVLRRSLSDPRFGISAAFAFGSLVQDRPVRDIDIAIQFAECSGDEMRRRWNLLRQEIDPLIEDAYGRSVNWQRFTARERDRTHAFLAKAGDFYILVGTEDA